VQTVRTLGVTERIRLASLAYHHSMFAGSISRKELSTKNALEKNIAIARGEALAANLLASAAIQAALAITSDREEVLAQTGHK